MKRYLELGRDFQDQFCTLALVLAADFRRLDESESLLWVSVSADGEDQLQDATDRLPDLVAMSFVPPFPDDSHVVVGSHISISTVQKRLAGLGWEKASPDDATAFYSYLDEHHGNYWQTLTPEQQERRIVEDMLWYEGIQRKRDEDERYLASLSPGEREREEKRRDEKMLASMRPREREQELQRRREIHFGTLRIPMKELITFSKTGTQYMVASGTGRPENGGTLLHIPEQGLFSIRLLTRKLMGDAFDEDGDVWALWEYNGKELRSVYGRYFREKEETGGSQNG